MKSPRIMCIKRSSRIHRVIPSLGALAIISCFLWLRTDLQPDQLRKDDSTGNASLAIALFGKRPLKIITHIKIQDTQLAKAVNNSMQDRLRLVERKCEEGWRPRNDTLFKDLNRIYFDSRRKLSYCHAAKAGCTFWLRIFTYLTRKKELKYFGITSPFMIERIHLHTGSLSPHTANYWSQVQSWVFSSSFKFLFARNPYTRLLSVYLDKYYLLGHSQTHFDPGLTCDNSKGLSFQRFLDFALDTFDHHLTPISELCNPCEYKPDAIGKMETFKSDAQYILDQGSYGYLLRHYNHSYRTEIEIDSIVGENFEFLADIQSRHGDDCMTTSSLSQRLWNVFQYNGYVPSNLNLPVEGLSSTKYGMLMYIKKIIRENPMDEDESRLQRTRYLSQFYSKIDKSSIERIKHWYSGDFELFGYSTDIPGVNKSQQ